MASNLRSHPSGLFLSNSIAAAAAKCRDSLLQCTNIPTLMQLEWAENRLAEFKLWAATTGALAGDAASLDARLISEPDTQDLVNGLLLLLTQCLEKCKNFALPSDEETEEVTEDLDEVNTAFENEDEWWANDLQRIDSAQGHDAARDIPRGFSPWSDDSSSYPASDSRSVAEDTSPLLEAEAEVEQIINHLARVALAIRKSGTSSRLHKADRTFDPSNHQKLRRHLELIVLARGREGGSSDYHIDREALTAIQERLILANLRRRNRYRYAQKHADKLAVDSTSASGAGAKFTALNVLALRQNDAAFRTPATALMANPRIEQTQGQEKDRVTHLNQVLTATSASGVAQPIDAVPKQILTPSRIAKTNITTTAAKVLYPKPPQSKMLQYFKCPCCFQTLPDMYREKTLWKKHMMADICPYMCILDECPTPEKLFVTRHEWTGHIEKNHWQCWQCPLCSTLGRPPVIFPSVEIFLCHLREAHSGSVNEEQYSTIVTEAARPIPLGICRCPLCDSTGPADSPDLLDHIAEHLHNFALRSLPWPNDGPGDKEARDPGDPYFNADEYFDDESENDSVQDVSTESDQDFDGLASLPRTSSRPSSAHCSNPEPLEGVHKYTIGWICIFPIEVAAAKAMLDEQHNVVFDLSQHDSNTYTLGRIGAHHVVIATLPHGVYGTSPCSTVARDMIRSFPSVRIGLMVGIGGGVPSAKHDIRLGDVVVGCGDGERESVVRFDLGKLIQNPSVSFDNSDFLNQPPTVLRTAVSSLASQYDMEGHQLDDYVLKALEAYPRLREKFSRPSLSSDRLYRSDCIHPVSPGSCESLCPTDSKWLVPRAKRGEDDDTIVHYGLIASGSHVIKDAVIRDTFAEKGVLCIDMAAVEQVDHFPILVIRGICDYSDSHKSKEWQGFAAMTAAAYAKDLLGKILPNKPKAALSISDDVRSISDKIRQNSQESELQRWLIPSDPSGNLAVARAQRHEGTGLWFLKGGAFAKWKTGKTRHLCLFGILGSGKTVLSTTIFDHLQDIDSSCTIAFFFDLQDSKKQTIDDLVRSLVWQLYLTVDASREGLENLYAACGNGTSQPSIHGLSLCFESMIQSCERVNIIIDALNECSTTNELVSWLETMACNPSSENIKLIVTGLPYFLQMLPSFLSHGDSVSLDEQAVSHDIRSYVDARLNQNTRFMMKQVPQELLDEMRTTLLDKANGRFRWTATQLDALADCHSLVAMKAYLENLPKTLNETYSRQLLSLPPVYRSDALRLLQFLVYTEEDQPLTLQEAVEIIATQIDTDAPHFDEGNRPFRNEDILQYCPSFVSFVPPLPQGGALTTIQLSPDVLEEHLLRENDFQLETASISITRTALTYLKDIDSDNNLKDVSADFPLAGRAANMVVKFARYAEADDGVLSEIMSFFLDSNALNRLFRLTGNSFGDHRVSSLFVACNAGLCRVARQLVEEGVDVNEGHSTEFNALYVASAKGFDEIVQLLLQNGADLHARGGTIWDPLLAASSNGHQDIVRLLVHYGADVTAEFDLFGTALHAASAKGHRDIVQHLIDCGADVNAGSDMPGTALQAASKNGDRDIVQLLLDHGATPDTESKVFGTAIQAASQNGHRDIVQLLLEYGAAPDAESNMFGTAMQAASKNGDLDVVQLLLDYGADVDMCNEEGNSPITLASSRGHVDVLRLLASVGAKVTDNTLREALQNSHFDVVKVLLDQDPSRLNHQSSLWHSALRAALGESHDRAVEILRSHSLCQAVTTGDYDAAKARLDEGANIDESSSLGNPLKLAVERRKVDIINLLLERGADVSIAADGGDLIEYYENRPPTRSRVMKEILDLLRKHQSGGLVHDELNDG